MLGRMGPLPNRMKRANVKKVNSKTILAISENGYLFVSEIEMGKNFTFKRFLFLDDLPLPFE